MVGYVDMGMGFFEHVSGVWQYTVGALTLFVSLVASGHAVLFKRDSRAAVLWVGVIWLAPVLGAVIYLLVGINRVRRRALLLRANLERHAVPGPICSLDELEESLPPGAKHLRPLATLGTRLTQRQLVPGNRITPLINGDEAFPAMLEAIRSAERSLTLATYIFDNDEAGKRFLEALGGAVRRGVQVRVLVDDTGARYSFPSIVRPLRKLGIPVARFLPTFRTRRLMTINLRNHRKILVADGSIGFTGGINIRAGNLLKEAPRSPVQDVQFRVEGPLVTQLQEVFADDWCYCTRESLRGDLWFPKLPQRGGAVGRGIADGPDEDFDKLRWTLLGALACAKSSVQIVTPYFLPDQSLISALNVAAMRGVKVDILLPQKSNLPFMQWAMSAILWQVLECGCRVFLTAPPFDHSKIMIVDRLWSFLGSANWDARSLRLNFEFNIEAYDWALAAQLNDIIEGKLQGAHELSLAEVDRRCVPIRLRDGVARLFSPYL